MKELFVALLAAVVVLVFMPMLIKYLRRHQFAQTIYELGPQAHDLLLQPGNFLRLGVLGAAALQFAVAAQQHAMFRHQLMDVFFKVWHDATAPCQVGLRKGWPPHRRAWPAAS